MRKTAWSVLCKSKVFFSEEKKQKTFDHWGVWSSGPTPQMAKVFWFFFSKKNILPPFSLVVASAAWAQPVPSDQPPASEDVVVTATGVPTPAQQIAAGVTVIDRATIQQRGYTDLVQALSAVPGLRVAQSGGPGSQASVFIRGTNSNHVLVLRDGIPINDPADPGGAFNFGDDTLDDIERIEIIRGPMSGLYGSGAIGGVINLITYHQSGGLHGSVTLAGGTQTTGLARANVAGSAGIWDLAASAEGFSTLGFDQTPERESVYTGESDGDREKLGTIEIGVTPVDGTRISFDIRTRESKYGYDEQGAVTYDGGNASGYDATVNGRLGIVSHLFDDAWTTSLILARVVDDRRYTVTADPLDPNDDTANDAYHGRRNDIAWNNVVHVPDIWHIDETAITFGYEHVNDEAGSSLNDVFGGYPYQSQLHAHDDTDAGTLGAQARLLRRLTMTGQVREDATTIAGDAFTWRVGGVFDVPEIGTRIKASYGTGFRAPALFDRYGVDSDGYVGNPDLRPEYSQGWEAGISTDLPVPASVGSATASVTYFDNRIHDLIELVYDYPLYTSENVQQARTKGVEASLSLRESGWFQADMGYTYTDARDLETGQLLLRRPENQGFADLRLTPFPGFNVVPELLYTGRFEDYITDDFGVPGFVPGLARSGLIVNLTMSWQVTPRVQLFIWGKNLGGSQFEPVSGYVTPGTSALIGTKVGF
jgi:vitamin B12 transporter